MTKLDKIIAEHIYNHLKKDVRFERLKSDILKLSDRELKEENAALKAVIKSHESRMASIAKYLKWINECYPDTPIAKKANALLNM